jgi:hypothetical protein
MLVQHAWHFFALREILSHVHEQLGLPPPPAFAPSLGLGGFALAGSSAIPNSLAAAMAQNPLAPRPSPERTLSSNVVSNKDREDTKQILTLLDAVCISIDVDLTNDISRAIHDADMSYVDRSKLQFHVEHITARLGDELRKQQFVHIPHDKVNYHSQLELFGAEVSKKFANVAEDISHAGTCYATGLNTACVFHLMRVMEHCVQRFGDKLKVPIKVESADWSKIMDLANKAIDKMPGGSKADPPIKATEEQRDYHKQMSLAAGFLNHVRIVWRNETMHPKATYDESEALLILRAVQTFLVSIVELVSYVPSQGGSNSLSARPLC